jgi:hypothetical protein
MKTQKDIRACIIYLQEQLDSLEHYLPETYQYLMDEMDVQHHALMKLKVQDFYSHQNHES